MAILKRNDFASTEALLINLMLGPRLMALVDGIAWSGLLASSIVTN